MPGHILAQGETQRRLVALKGFALQHIAQRDQGHLFVWNLDPHIAVPWDRSLYANPWRSQRQCQIIGQGGNLAHAHPRPTIAGLDEQRLHAKLRDRRPAAYLHHLRRRAKRSERLLNEMRPLFDEVLTYGGGIAGIQDVSNLGDHPLHCRRTGRRCNSGHLRSRKRPGTSSRDSSLVLLQWGVAVGLSQ
jgi:hypothetical protein